jgi:hypothetical protein
MWWLKKNQHVFQKKERSHQESHGAVYLVWPDDVHGHLWRGKAEACDLQEHTQRWLQWHQGPILWIKNEKLRIWILHR